MFEVISVKKEINFHSNMKSIYTNPLFLNCTGVEWVEISQKNFVRFFGPRMFVRS